MPAANRLRELIDNPDSFTGSPGYTFARDQGLQAAQRAMSRTRGSGNALAELTRLGTGYAAQDYGNTVDRLRGIVSDENQFALGTEQNRIAATRNANDFALGNRNADNTRRANDQSYGVNLLRTGNDFTLGRERNANDASRTGLDWWNSTQDQAARRRREALDWWDRYNTGGG